jgi:hypothetical protein
MWSDTLQTLERAHLTALAVWGSASLAIGLLLLLPLLIRRARAPIIAQFALQCALWGSIELAWVLAARTQVPLRDYASALQLAGSLWLVIEMAAAGVVIGATLAWGGWAFGRRLTFVGSGMGIAVQSAALLVLDIIFVRGIHL